MPGFGEIGERLTDLRFETVAQIAEQIEAVVPTADPERVHAFAHAVSGVGEQLGRSWLRNQDVPRGRVVAHYTDFIWSGLPQLGDAADG